MKRFSKSHESDFTLFLDFIDDTIMAIDTAKPTKGGPGGEGEWYCNGYMNMYYYIEKDGTKYSVNVEVSECDDYDEE